MTGLPASKKMRLWSCFCIFYKNMPFLANEILSLLKINNFYLTGFHNHSKSFILDVISPTILNPSFIRKDFDPPPVPRPLQGVGSTAPPRRSFTKVLLP